MGSAVAVSALCSSKGRFLSRWLWRNWHDWLSSRRIGWNRQIPVIIMSTRNGPNIISVPYRITMMNVSSNWWTNHSRVHQPFLYPTRIDVTESMCSLASYWVDKKTRLSSEQLETFEAMAMLETRLVCRRLPKSMDVEYTPTSRRNSYRNELSRQLSSSSFTQKVVRVYP